MNIKLYASQSRIQIKALRFCEEQGVTMRNSYSLSNGYNAAIRKTRNALVGILGCEEYVRFAIKFMIKSAFARCC